MKIETHVELNRKIEQAGEVLLADYKLTYPEADTIWASHLIEHAYKIMDMSVDNDLLEGIIDDNRQDDPEFKRLLLIAGAYFIV
jgi:hypothetical protein